MNKSISPGEIAAGQYLTVLENRPYTKESEDMLGMAQVLTQEDRSGMGDIFLVIAVDLPYVALEYVKGFLKKERVCFDTRLSTFMELKTEFVDAFMKK
jgi:hypothetical protein